MIRISVVKAHSQHPQQHHCWEWSLEGLNNSVELRTHRNQLSEQVVLKALLISLGLATSTPTKFCTRILRTIVTTRACPKNKRIEQNMYIVPI